MKRKQKPKHCDHCNKWFKSGAGLALHLRQLEDPDTYNTNKGKKLKGEQLKKQQERARYAQKFSPNGKKAGERFTVTCSGCGNRLSVKEHRFKSNSRFFCDKSCESIGRKGETTYTRTEETNKRASESAKLRAQREGPRKNPFFGVTPENYKGFGKGGFCEELGFSVRSTWERDYLIALKEAGIKFIYEPERFDLEDCTYLPDILLVGTNTYIEIKGYDKESCKYKRKRFIELTNNKLHLVNKKPTELNKQDLVNFCRKEVGGHV